MLDNKGSNERPLIYYIIIAASIIMLLNAFVFPALLQRQVMTVGYSDFLAMVDKGQVKEVQLDQNSEQMIFLAVDDEGEEMVCKTAVYCHVLCAWAGAHESDGQAHGRIECHEFRQVQCQDCGSG